MIAACGSGVPVPPRDPESISAEGVPTRSFFLPFLSVLFFDS